MSIGFVEITVGRFLCGQVRGFLNKCKFKGMNITLNESNGLIERNFTIKGSREELSIVRCSLDDWIRSMDG